MDLNAVCRSNAGALLPTMLEGIYAEESDAGYVLSGVVNSHHTAGFTSGVCVEERLGRSR